MTGYQELNRRNWDERAPVHAASVAYGLERYRDPSFVNDIVAFDRERLGDLSGVRGVHLQCHIGTDTVSLSRLGARMTGLDFSPASLAEARRLAALAGAEVDFVESEVYDAVAALGGQQFDLVFTGIGALCWLPDMRRWAQVVAELLRPGGRLFLREGHPVLLSLADPRPDGVLSIEYPYFELPEPMEFDEPGTYVDGETDWQHTRTQEWSHGIGDVITALLDAGLALTSFVEHDTVPWDAMPGQMRQVGGGEWQLADRPRRVPHTYTLQAVKIG